jgi:hypothetical protein
MPTFVAGCACCGCAASAAAAGAVDAAALAQAPIVAWSRFQTARPHTRFGTARLSGTRRPRHGLSGRSPSSSSWAAGRYGTYPSFSMRGGAGTANTVYR